MSIARPQSTTNTFANPRPLVAVLRRPAAGYAWFFLRIYIGWQWLMAGWEKLEGPGSVGWIHAGTVGGKQMPAGGRLLAFWQHAVAPSPSGMPAVAFPWYRDFLQMLIAHHAEHWFVYLVAAGEFLVGMALLLGLLTAVAAACGAFLNLNYMLAGSASLNPVLFLGALLLLLAWRVAGYVGLDRWLLPLLGMPWQPGLLFRRGAAAAPRRRSYAPQPERRARPSAREHAIALRRRHHPVGR